MSSSKNHRHKLYLNVERDLLSDRDWPPLNASSSASGAGASTSSSSAALASLAPPPLGEMSVDMRVVQDDQDAFSGFGKETVSEEHISKMGESSYISLGGGHSRCMR